MLKILVALGLALMSVAANLACLVCLALTLIQLTGIGVVTLSGWMPQSTQVERILSTAFGMLMFFFLGRWLLEGAQMLVPPEPKPTGRPQ